MIWRSTMKLLCPDHRCEPEGDMKQTSRPVADFQAALGGLAVVPGGRVLQKGPAPPTAQGPSGSQHPPRSSAPVALLGMRCGLPSAPPAPRLRVETGGDRHPAGKPGSGPALRAPGGDGTPGTDSPDSAPDGLAHPPRFTLAPPGPGPRRSADPAAPPCPPSRGHLPAAGQ